MKRSRTPRRARPSLRRTLGTILPRLGVTRVDGRVTLAVLWALDRLAQRLGPAA